jgi:dipeptidyl aminopeptidase/acylaminoacyl peptidase
MKSKTLSRFLLVYLWLLTPIVTFAQLPETEIWLFDIETRNDSILILNGQNITQADGYDSQPFFSADNHLLYYTSARKSKQTDIYTYDLLSGITTRFTNTPVSEYSPMITPDGQFLSVVMVEKDSTQRVWKYPLAGGEAQLVLPNIDSVGYYRWINSDSLALVLISDPLSLVTTHSTTQKIRLLTYDIGRTMQLSVDGTLLYMGYQGHDEYSLYSSNVSSEKKCPPLYFPAKVQDFVVWGERAVIYGKDNSSHLHSQSFIRLFLRRKRASTCHT